MKKVAILLTLLCLALPISSYADISIPWDTTFDCDEQDQDSTMDCDGLVWWSHEGHIKISLSDGSADNWTQSPANNDEYYYTGSGLDSPNDNPASVAVDTTFQTIGTPGSLSDNQSGWGDNDSIGSDTLYIKQATDPDSQRDDYVYSFKGRSAAISGDKISDIVTAANNPLGTGRGLRKWYGDGNSVGTGSVRALFTELQTILRIRWYITFEGGFTWDSISSDKHFYIYTQTGGTQAIAEFQGTVYRVAQQNTPDSHQLDSSTGEGWPVSQGGASGQPVTEVFGSGDPVCFEVYIKMNTAGESDGLGRIWRDGLLIAENLAIDWSGGSATAEEGWEYFVFLSNQGYPRNAKSAWVYVDDIVALNTDAAANKDAAGNDMIGPIDWPAASTGETVSGASIAGCQVQ